LKPVKQSILSPLAAAVVSIDVAEGQLVDKNQIVAVLESMKMQSRDSCAHCWCSC